MSKIYGPFDATSFKDGDRVETAPHLDLWMRGARVGDVVKVGKTRVHVRLDALPKRVLRFDPSDIFAVMDCGVDQ